jgi:molybdenum cofactor biosynthesis protein A
MLTDSYGRNINYLRLAVTDRCNLRCSYCMPAEGLNWLPRNGLLSYEEILVLLEAFHQAGITKLRFTGGEPFLRKDFMKLVESVFDKNWFEQISITTNGTLTAPHVKQLKTLGIHSINLSLDTMNQARFTKITRRNDFDAVMQTLDALETHEVKTRVNAVVMDGINEEDIIALPMAFQNKNIDIRFIEEMPFNGEGKRGELKWNAAKILSTLQAYFGNLIKLEDDAHSTSMNYQIPGHLGKVGIIAAYTRSFCGTCNRIRVTPTGQIKTCLYEKSGFDLKAPLRNGAHQDELVNIIRDIVGKKYRNGFEAESHRNKIPVTESMSTIGG